MRLDECFPANVSNSKISAQYQNKIKWLFQLIFVDGKTSPGIHEYMYILRIWKTSPQLTLLYLTEYPELILKHRFQQIYRQFNNTQLKSTNWYSFPTGIGKDNNTRTRSMEKHKKQTA